MAHSRVFGFLAITLCLVVCLCANADVSYEEADKAVEDVQKYTKKVLKSADDGARDAFYVKRETEKYKREAEQAATQAQKAAGGNSEAGKIAQEAKEAADKVTQAYPDAIAAAKKYSDAITALRAKARELVAKAKNKLKVGNTNDDYNTANAAAILLENEAKELDKNINASLEFYFAAYSAQKDMPEDSKTAQLKKYHVDAIVAVAKFEPLLKEADRNIVLIEQKRDEVQSTVQAMNTLRDNAPKELLNNIQTLIFYANNELASASSSVEDAKKRKQEMLSQKAKANEALEKVRTGTVVDDARSEAQEAEWHASAAAQKIEEIKKALRSAETDAFNANARKNTAVSEINKRKNTSTPPVEDSEERASGSGNEEQSRPNRDTKTTGTPDKSTNKNSGEPVQDRTKNPGKGGSDLTSGTTDDSAMTVSVSLLLLLIACATLH